MSETNRPMRLLLIGMSHRSAELSLRERFTIPVRELPAALDLLRRDPAIIETTILSTCNRLEFYVVPSDEAAAVKAIEDVLAFRSRLNPDTFRSHLYVLRGEAAAAHAIRVSAGLDSMILGESEIAAQVKEAYRVAHEQQAAGPVLHRLFQKAFHAAKAIRTTTDVSRGAASVGAAVVDLARDRLRIRLSEADVLLWGAGKAAEATAKHLMKQGIRQLWVVNRTQPKAEDLASLCRGGWLSWEHALAHLAGVDIAVVCTQAPHYVIDRDDVEPLMAARRDRPLYLIDLAVPRNVDPCVGAISGVALSNVDDLASMTDRALAQRRQALAQCEQLVDYHVAGLRSRVRPIREQEVSPCASLAA